MFRQPMDWTAFSYDIAGWRLLVNYRVRKRLSESVVWNSRVSGSMPTFHGEVLIISTFLVFWGQIGAIQVDVDPSRVITTCYFGLKPYINLLYQGFATSSSFGVGFFGS